MILQYIKEYWTQIIFVLSVLGFLYNYIKNSNEAMKCSLRNDILTIYNNCKDKKEITLYELQAINYSYVAYKKMKGNSFVDDIVNLIHTFKVVD